MPTINREQWSSERVKCEIANVMKMLDIDRMPSFEEIKHATNDDWFKAITHKPIRVEIKHEEYLGNTRARVGYVYESEHPEVSLAGQGFVEVNDEDLPF